MESTNELVTAAEARAEGLSLDGVANNRCITKQQFNDNLPSGGDAVIIKTGNNESNLTLSMLTTVIAQGGQLHLIYFGNVSNKAITVNIQCLDDRATFSLSPGQTGIYVILGVWSSDMEVYCDLSARKTWYLNGAVLGTSGTENAFNYVSQASGSTLTISAPMGEDAYASITTIGLA